MRAHRESGDDASNTNEAAVDAVVAGLSVPQSDPRWLARARLALTLARALDVGAGRSTEAVSRELRLTLASLTPEVGTDDDTREFLSAPAVRVTAESPLGDVRPSPGAGRGTAGAPQPHAVDDFHSG